jgi:hypothetical protein
MEPSPGDLRLIRASRAVLTSLNGYSIILRMKDEEIEAVARELGSRGGHATAKRYGTEHLRKLQQKSTKVKIGNKKGTKNTESFGA